MPVQADLPLQSCIAFSRSKLTDCTAAGVLKLGRFALQVSVHVLAVAKSERAHTGKLVIELSHCFR